MKNSFHVLILCLLSASLSAQETPLRIADLKPVNVVLKEVNYKGKNGIRMAGNGMRNHLHEIAIVKNAQFTNGTIEVELSGDRLPDSDSSYRGFVGIAFRVKEADTMRFECLYIRPTNGRTDDQLRRNHSTQYTAEPEYPWFRLRKEAPGVYESYADMVEGEWTKIKITVHDRSAKLYVNGATQPCLVINDLKHGIQPGSIALWIGVGTEAHFRNLKVISE